MKKKEYYTEELEKSPIEKMQAIENQKFYTSQPPNLPLDSWCGKPYFG